MSQSVENTREMFGTDSLMWVLFQEQFWAKPPYSRSQANSFIGRYRAGGVQDLPEKYSGNARTREEFRGLDESISLQEQAAEKWQSVLAQTRDIDVRSRMEADVVWFLATASRYRLMAGTCDYLLSPAGSQQQADARERMEAEIAYLDRSRVTRDAISPIDQQDFIAYHRNLLSTLQN
jgi:hypothetical protein